MNELQNESKRKEIKEEDVKELIMLINIIDNKRERARKENINKLKQIILLNEKEIEKMKTNSAE